MFKIFTSYVVKLNNNVEDRTRMGEKYWRYFKNTVKTGKKTVFLGK